MAENPGKNPVIIDKSGKTNPNGSSKSNEQAIELARSQTPVSRSEVMIGAGEVGKRTRRRPMPNLPVEEPIITRQKAWFTITIATSPNKPPTRLRLGKVTGAILLLTVVAVLAMAGITIVNLLSGSNTANGDSLAWQNSATVREEQRQQAIDLQERRLNDLSEENKKRLLEIGELEGQLQDINDSLNTLRGVSKQLQDLLGTGQTQGSTSGSSSQIPLVPGPTVKGQGGDNATYIPPIRVQGGYIDPQQGQLYLNQFNSLLNKLDGVSQLLSTRKKSVTEYQIQLANYRQDLSQQKAQLDAAAASLQKLSKLADSDAAPDTLPWFGPITSTYGWRLSPFRPGTQEFHYGVDISASEGTPVQVTKPGVVTYIGYDPGYGNMVEVTHTGGWLTRYGHNSRIVAKLGQTVQKGDIIALSGNTGASTGPHIHYEIHKNGVPVNPANYVPALANKQ